MNSMLYCLLEIDIVKKKKNAAAVMCQLAVFVFTTYRLVFSFEKLSGT